MMMTERKVSFYILGVWFVYLCTLAILQAFHLPFGFKVWAMGEDRNWLGFIHDGHGMKMIHLFWQMNDRNPLSPWWWFAISPFIKMSDWSLYFIRKCVDPFLAITVFLLLDRLGRQQCRTFAFSVALAVLFWNFSAYYEQIMWEFLAALGFNLLAIYFYCLYVDNKRQAGSYLALGLICYLIAITTYTLQSGAILAIACLAFFRQNGLTKPPILTRLYQTILDSSFFLLIFMIYNCIWYTVNRNSGEFYVFNLHTFFQQLSASLKQFFYHPSYTALWNMMNNDWPMSTIIVMLVSAFIFSLLILSIAYKRQIISIQKNIPIGWVCVVLAAIALPTIAVEATSQIWYPGSRSLMVQQVWQPLLYLSMIFLIASLLPIRWQKTILLISISLFTAIVMLAGFNYNYRLVLRTHYQVTLIKQLKKMAPKKLERRFLVKFIGKNTSDLDTISNFIGNSGVTMMKQDNVSIRTFQTTPVPEQAPFWIIKFNEDSKGVNNAAPIGNNNLIPYANVWIVFFDGEKAWLPATVKKEDFAGLQVDWQRNQPINQTNKIKRCL